MKIPSKRRDGLEQGEVEQPREVSRRNSRRGLVDDQMGKGGRQAGGIQDEPRFLA